MMKRLPRRKGGAVILGVIGSGRLLPFTVELAASDR